MATAIALQNPFKQIPRVPSPGDIYKDSGCLLFFFSFLGANKSKHAVRISAEIAGNSQGMCFFLLLMLFSPLLLTLVAFKQKVVVFAISQLEELAVLPTFVLFLSPNRAHYLSLTLKKHGAEPIDHNQKW